MLKRIVLLFVLLTFAINQAGVGASAPASIRAFIREMVQVLKYKTRNVDWEKVANETLEGLHGLEQSERIIEHIRELMKKAGDPKNKSDQLYNHVQRCDLCQKVIDMANSVLLPRGEFREIWVDNNALNNGQYGVQIHLSFEVSNLEGVKCKAVAYFFFESGEPIEGDDSSFPPKGEVSVSFTPSYPDAVFKDFTIFMPYDELGLDTGEYDLKCRVELSDFSTEMPLAISDYEYFQHSEP